MSGYISTPKMKRSNSVGSCQLQVTAFAQLNCRLVKLLKTNQMWLEPLNFSRIGRKLWVKKKWVFLSFSSVFQSCLSYIKARLSCKGVMTIYQSQNIKVSPSVRLSGPSVLWFLYLAAIFNLSITWLTWSMLKNKYQNHIIEGLELYKIAFLHDFIVGRKTAL